MTQKPEYTLDDLLYLMSRLRAPENGCPWDRKQTFESIIPHTIEEAYEVADAIRQKDFPHVKEELGDLLFQVIFYSQLGKENEYFDFSGVVSDLVAKLIRRHPHVFPDGSLDSFLSEGAVISEEEIKANWERIKAQEIQEKHKSIDNSSSKGESKSLLSSVPGTLPPLVIAEKLQKKAATVGFDWKEIGPVFDKLEEELGELKEAWNTLQKDDNTEIQQAEFQSHVEDELGDLLFVCVNLARFLKVKPDQALMRTNDKFRKRFAFIESSLREKNLELGDVTLDEMEALWQKAKTDPGH